MPGSNTYSMLSAQPTGGGSSTAGGVMSQTSTQGQNVNTGSSGVGFLDIASVFANPLVGLANTGINFYASNLQQREALKQWNRENEYNLPKNQVKRLLDAGLNPALMYQNGASGLISANSPEISKAANSALVGVDPATAAQIRNLDAQTESIKDQNRRENEKQPLTLSGLAADIENTLADTAVKDTEVALNRAFEGKALNEARSIYQEYLFLRRSLADRLSILGDQKTVEHVNAMYIERNLLAQIRQSNALASLYRQQIETELSKKNLNDAERGLLEKKKEEVDSVIRHNNALAVNVEKHNKFVEAEFWIHSTTEVANSTARVIDAVTPW